MPAKSGAKHFDYPEFAEYDLQHNPGRDFLRMLAWCAEADDAKFNQVFAAYARSPIAIFLGCAAIEGYLNYAGHAIITDWPVFLKTTKTFSEKLKHILKERSVKADIGSG